MSSIIKPIGLLTTIAMVLLASQFACKKTDGYNEIVSTDKTKPGPVTNVHVANYNGGAYITYTLPNSKNILYVQAQYMINDQLSRQTKSSYYSDSLQVDGFAKSKDYKVVLYTVTRADVKSDSVVVMVHPDTPPYLLVAKNLSIQKDFGGARIKSLNKSMASVGIITITPDSTNKLAVKDQNYTAVDTIDYSIRGYDTIARKFGVYVTDKWGNLSDTLFATITPIFETQMDKSKFRPYVLPTDVADFGFGFVLTNLWDNNVGEPTYNTQQPILPNSNKPDIWPAWCTFDMGQAVKFSRYNMIGRSGDNGQFLWSEGTPQTWVIWGRPDTPQDEMMPDANNIPPLGTITPNGWINLGYFTAPDKPSKLPNPQFTNSDFSFWKAGFNYDFSLDLPKVRYIRFECLTNMGGTNNFFDINEMTFFGDPR